MTKKKQKARAQLREAADELVGEMLRGKWDHVKNLKNHPIDKLVELFEELEIRCPGHSKQEYKETFRRSHWENR